MIRRLLFVFIVILAAAAVLMLRVRGGAPPAASESGQEAPRSTPPFLPVPPDYTLRPLVAADEVDAGPERIISLAPSITETLCALGMQDRLVGRTQFCLHPPGIEDQVPVVGALVDTNLARIKMLQPDLVLATWNSGDVARSLRKLDVRCETLPHENLEDIYRAIEQIGQLCARPGSAGLLIQAIREDVAAQQQAGVALGMDPMSVLVTTGPLPLEPRDLWVAGPGSFFDELLKLAGHRNAADRLEQSFTELSLVTLLQINPEVILEFRDPTEAADRDALYHAWSRLGTLRAIRQRRVRTVGSEEWLSAGPRVALGLHRLIATMAEYR